jgi:hypothetical protein
MTPSIRVLEYEGLGPDDGLPEVVGPDSGGVQWERFGTGSIARDAHATTVVDASGIDVYALMETYGRRVSPRAATS